MQKLELKNIKEYFVCKKLKEFGIFWNVILFPLLSETQQKCSFVGNII